MSKRMCAYCKKNNKLTREHIWPAGIIKKVNHRGRYSSLFNKVIWSDFTIKDVCATCNNGVLSEIDSYGLQLFNQYFEYYININSEIEFNYNYSLLARWLLKLSFNSARAVKSDFERLEKYSEVLIDLEKELPFDFSIFLDIVLPTLNPENEKQIFPDSNRICRIQFSDNVGDWCTVRLVAINSYYFWILIQDKMDDEINMEHAEAVLSRIKGYYLQPSEFKIIIKPLGTTMLEMHKDWANIIGEYSFEKKTNKTVY
jgi:hypothetical protein